MLTGATAGPSEVLSGAGGPRVMALDSLGATAGNPPAGADEEGESHGLTATAGGGRGAGPPAVPAASGGASSAAARNSWLTAAGLLLLGLLVGVVVSRWADSHGGAGPGGGANELDTAACRSPTPAPAPQPSPLVFRPRHPRTFVYPVPEAYLAARKDMYACTDTYAVEWIIPMLLLHDPQTRALWNVVDDPAQADLFVVTAPFSCKLEGCAYEVPRPASCDTMRTTWIADFILDAASRWPYFNRSGGHDHLITLSMDSGRCEMREPTLSLIANMTGLLTLGYRNTSSPCFHAQRDIVVPPYSLVAARTDFRQRATAYVDALGAPWVNAHAMTMPRGFNFPGVYAVDRGQRANLAHFRGTITNPVREALVVKYGGASGFDVSRDRNYDTYYAEIANATFGLCPSGGEPWSPRFVDYLSAGTIPVFVTDEWLLPYEDSLPAHLWSLRFTHAAAIGTDMGMALRALSPEQVFALRAHGQRALRAFTYHGDAMWYLWLEVKRKLAPVLASLGRPLTPEEPLGGPDRDNQFR